MGPIIGITADREGEKYTLGLGYARLVWECGGTPVILPHVLDSIGEYVTLCDGFVLTGGDDPTMEPWGVATHPQVKPIDETRQAFEVGLLRALGSVAARDTPVLGICLGMQLMALEAGGALDQHLPETDPEAATRHWGKVTHRVVGDIGEGTVLSHHRQAVTDPGRLGISARAEDGMIEAVCDRDRVFFLGVQWHPERTEDVPLGRGLFARFIAACTAASQVV